MYLHRQFWKDTEGWDFIARDKFLKRVRFPVPMIRDLCQINTLFEGYEINCNDTNEIDGVQMTLAF